MAGASALMRLLRSPGFRRLVTQAGPVVGPPLLRLVQQERWRQVALLHARTLQDGTVSKVMVTGNVHHLVWSGDEVVALYPTASESLAKVARTADPDQRMRPEDMPVSQALKGVTDAARRIAERARELSAQTQTENERPGKS